MKKLLLASLFLVIAGISYAANQYNWGTSNGNSWQTPNDATVLPNQFIVVGATDSVNPIIKAVSEPALYSQTVSQITTSTASFTGEIVFCSDCVASPICVSTGSTNANQWVVVGTSNTFAAGFVRCK